MDASAAAVLTQPTQLVEVSNLWTAISVVVRVAMIGAFLVGAYLPMTREVFIAGPLRFFRLLIWTLGTMFVLGSGVSVLLSARRLLGITDPIAFLGEATAVVTTIIAVSSFAWILIYQGRHR